MQTRIGWHMKGQVQLKTPMQRLIHKCGNDTREKKNTFLKNYLDKSYNYFKKLLQYMSWDNSIWTVTRLWAGKQV
jgi:hypothetical protein